MKTPFFRLIALLAFTIALPAAAAARDGTTTIAIVPTVDAATGATFPIAHDPKNSGAIRRAKLTFDLSAIPAGVKINSAVLRLVAKDTVERNQLVRIFENKNYKNPSVGQLNPGLSPTRRIVNSTGKGLTDAVVKAKARGGAFDLYLATTSVPANQVVYYSDRDDAPSASRPRLIVSWNDAAPQVARAGAELRYRGDPADMTPWRHDAPQGAIVSTPLSRINLNEIFAGPVFRADEILVIAAPDTGTGRRLYGFGWNGNKRWDLELPPLKDSTATWKYLHVDEQGRVLAFRNDETISVFEAFGSSGPAKRTDHAIAGLKLTKRPAVSAGGVVVFRNDAATDAGYARALSPSPGFRELWRSPTNVGKSSAPVLSPRPGDNLAYVMGEQPKALSVFDAPTGESRLTTPFPSDSKLSDFADFHPALTVEGPAHDWVFLSGYSQSGGRLEGYTDFTKSDPSAWSSMKDGPVSRCIAPPKAISTPQPPPDFIYCIQNGQLRAFEVTTGNQKCSSAEPTFVKDGKTYALSATSNLVADGAGNIYFWDEEKPSFYGFDRDCKKLFGESLGSLPANADGSKVLELRAGPNGVFYLTSDKKLFAVQPTGSGPLTALAANTRYARSGDVALTSAIAPPQNAPVIVVTAQKLSFGNFQVPVGTDVTCSAGQGISFDPGFKVAKGGVLRCGIEAR